MRGVKRPTQCLMTNLHITYLEVNKSCSWNAINHSLLAVGIQSHLMKSCHAVLCVLRNDTHLCHNYIKRREFNSKTLTHLAYLLLLKDNDWLGCRMHVARREG